MTSSEYDYNLMFREILVGMTVGLAPVTATKTQSVKAIVSNGVKEVNFYVPPCFF